MITYNLDYFNRLNTLLSYGFNNIKEEELLKERLLDSLEIDIEKHKIDDYSKDELIELFYKVKSCVYSLEKIKGIDKKIFYINVIDILNQDRKSLKTEDLIFIIKQF